MAQKNIGEIEIKNEIKISLFFKELEFAACNEDKPKIKIGARKAKRMLNKVDSRKVLKLEQSHTKGGKY